MNSRRSSKPNLPNVLKPSKLLLQWCYAEPISSLAYRIPLLNHRINQYEIGPFLIASQTSNDLLIDMGMVRKGFDNVPLKDMTMERKRVEEFEESWSMQNCKCTVSLFYSKVMRRVSSSGIGNLLLTNTKIMLISILSREVTKVFVTGI